MVAAISAALVSVIFAYVFLSPNKGGPKSPAATDAGQTKGEMMLELSPADPKKTSTMKLSAKGFDPAAARIEWMIDGSPFTPVDPMTIALSNEFFAKKGSVIRARAIVTGREIISNEARIANSPPELTVRLEEQSQTGQRLSIKAEAHDPDGDDIRYEYVWSVNGAPAGTTDTLENRVRRGDHIVVRATAFDDESDSGPQIIERTIQNMPPEIAEDTKNKIENGVFEYHVKASDPDDDTLAYSLESPPPGMTIDGATGLLRWNVPQEFKGKKNITAVVADGNGGSAKYTIIITIQ